MTIHRQLTIPFFNPHLFKRVKAVYEKRDSLGLDQDQMKLLENTYKGFVRSGANLSEEDKGNAIRLDVYYSKASGKAYLQLFEYVPYKYEPCTKVYEYEIAKVGKLIK